MQEVEAGPEKRRDRFIADLVEVCKRHRVILEPDGSEWGSLDIDEVVFSEFDASKDITFYISLGVVEEAIRQAVWPIIHPET